MQNLSILLLLATVLCSCTSNNIKQSKETRYLLVEKHDQKWKTEIYDKIKGKNHAEKADNATTNWEMKAVSEMKLWTIDDDLSAIYNKLYDAYPNKEKMLFERLHNNWVVYTKSQADFLTNNSGSLASLYYRSILVDEMRKRLVFYKELEKGNSVFTTGFTMYKD